MVIKLLLEDLSSLQRKTIDVKERIGDGRVDRAIVSIAELQKGLNSIVHKLQIYVK